MKERFLVTVPIEVNDREYYYKNDDVWREKTASFMVDDIKNIHDRCERPGIFIEFKSGRNSIAVLMKKEEFMEKVGIRHMDLRESIMKG